ncbi:MAG: heparinase II/III family protein [Hyphomicrobiaceae bacterium]
MYSRHASPKLRERGSARLLTALSGLGLHVFFLLSLLATSASQPALANKLQACSDTTDVRNDLSAIDSYGARPGTKNLFLNKRVLGLATCAQATGDASAAEVVVRALVQYARVVKHWPMLGRSGRPELWTNWTYWDVGGLWGGEWIYEDLLQSENLARAFELVRGTPAIAKVSKELGIDTGKMIREDLLRYLVDHNLRFGRGTVVGTNSQEALFPFSNMDPIRIRALATFGRVVDPAYTHIAVQLLRDFPRVGFFRDGFWHEGTISYHRQVINGLDAATRALKGYSDPAGYSFTSYTTLFGNRYEGVPGRFDNLDPEGDWAPVFQRIRQASYPFTMLDGRMVARNDTHQSDRGNPINAPQRSNCLLGLRHCVLVSGEGKDRTIVHLTFGGSNGHEHLDKLHIDIWAAGRMLVSDGDYWRGSSRDWNTSTPAHNTVTIDGRNQNNRWANQRRLTSIDLIDGVGNHLWQGFGQGNSDNQGDLIAADISGGAVQYVVADARRAYGRPGDIGLYERTLVLVAPEGRAPYLVDVFRVHGGSQQQWMLHGDLGANYDLSISLPSRNDSQSLFLHLLKQSRATASENWRSDIVFEDQKRLATYHLHTSPADVFIASGPAHAASGRAKYLGVTKHGPDNIFVNVHDLSGTGKGLRLAKLTSAPASADAPLALEVTRADGTRDILELGASRETREVGKARVHLVSHDKNGACLLNYKGDVASDASSWQNSPIEVTSAPNHGDASFTVAGPLSDAPQQAQFLHLLLGNGVVESYRIKAIRARGADRHEIVVDGEAGLELRTDKKAGAMSTFTKLTYYPGAGIMGTPRWRVTSNGMPGC